MAGPSEAGPSEDEGEDAPPPVVATVTAGGRLDKVLAAAAPSLSRSRLAALIAEGRVAGPDGPVRDGAAKVAAGATFEIAVPLPAPAAPRPEAIPLDVVHDDPALIVVNKPAGMVVHPAPGAERGTLVAALLHWCGESLSGVGGVARPGVVHRIDKDTSGLLVVAKTDAAHVALSAQFAAHSIERVYDAVVRGAPDRADPRLAGHPAATFEPGGWLRVEAPLARARADRKRMAVDAAGRRAVTRARVVARFGAKPDAALLECRLDTGRTHQIRVHLSHIGHPLLGDPVYGRATAALAGGLARQALHARVLGFDHPVTGARVRFERPPPADLASVIARLQGLPR